MSNCLHSHTKIEAYDIYGSRHILTSCANCGVLLSNRQKEIDNFDDLTISQDWFNKGFAEMHGWTKKGR